MLLDDAGDNPRLRHLNQSVFFQQIDVVIELGRRQIKLSGNLLDGFCAVKQCLDNLLP